MRKVQIQFTEEQLAKLQLLRQQTGATRTKLVRRAVDYYISEIQSNGTQKPLISLPTADTKKAR